MFGTMKNFHWCVSPDLYDIFSGSLSIIWAIFAQIGDDVFPKKCALMYGNFDHFFDINTNSMPTNMQFQAVNFMTMRWVTKSTKYKNVKFSGCTVYNQEMGDRPKPSGPGVARVGHLESWKADVLQGLLTMLTISGGAELPGEEVLAGCGERGCCQHQVYIVLIFLQQTCRFPTWFFTGGC